ncbi:hypothetical protein FB561_6660 [Kribbella amoyensis]|uniref:Beta/gamma crystallin n=1 Tax=Kribbella amoyensis TaxID=996641 RepID=A0A561B944_9ACTN|nr:hypothetical protein [Kribbella amoyensis]TWD75222.1 hypothetical protein FB561_6660 [Kribbella amoyensis]
MRTKRWTMGALAAAGALAATVLTTPQAQATEPANCVTGDDTWGVIRGIGSGQMACFEGAGEYGFTGGYPDVFQINTGKWSGYIIYHIPGGKDVMRDFKAQQTLHFDPKVTLYTLHIN